MRTGSARVDETMRTGWWGRGRVARAAVVLCLLGSTLTAGLTTAGGAHADDLDSKKDQVAGQLDEARAKLANLSAKSQEAVLALQATQAKFADAQKALAASQAAETAAIGKKAQADADLTKAQADEAAGLARLAAIQGQQAKNTDIRNNIARQAYEGAGLERLAAVLNTDHAADLANSMYVVEKVNDSQNALLADLAAAKAKADEEQARLADSRRRIATAQLQAQAAVQQAGQARADADKKRADLAAVQLEQAQAAQAVAAQRDEEAKRAGELQKASDDIAAQLAARAAAEAAANGTVPVPWSDGDGRYALPVIGPFTSEFEWRINPILGTRELHSGIDIGVPCGTPVHASGDGTVIHAAVTGGYGNSVWIDHGAGMATTYNHMERIDTHLGAQVKRGDVIGLVGTTGLSTGCHMHWEVRVNGVPVNPRGWFGGPNATTPPATPTT